MADMAPMNHEAMESAAQEMADAKKKKRMQKKKRMIAMDK